MSVSPRCLLLSAGLCAACGPSLTDEPTAYEGTNDFSMAVLCGSETVKPGDKAWAKFATRHTRGVEPEWESETIEVEGGVLTRRAAGRPTPQESGHIRRIETFWVQAPEEARPGDVLRVGPLEVRYLLGGRTVRTGRQEGCTFTVK